MAKSRRWNLNEAEGRYAATNLADAVIDLELGMKRIDGRREALGRYLLDLLPLAQLGFVTRRQVGGSAVFDVQIYREPNGALLLGVRQGHTTKLERFRVS